MILLLQVPLHYNNFVFFSFSAIRITNVCFNPSIVDSMDVTNNFNEDLKPTTKTRAAKENKIAITAIMSLKFLMNW